MNKTVEQKSWRRFYGNVRRPGFVYFLSRLNMKNKIFHGSSDRDGKTRQLPVDVVRSESEVTIGATGPRYRPIAYLPPVRKMRYKPWKMLQDIHSITNHWLDKTS